MKHEIIGDKVFTGGITWQYKVKLIPQNETEREAISKVVSVTATPEQSELVDNYLTFLIKGHSIVDCESQGGGIFLIKVAK